MALKKKTLNKLPSSFRDPSGFMFEYRGKLYRQINKVYKKNYDLLIKSGLYDRLVENNLLTPHREARIEKQKSKDIYKIIEPESIPFISYPYEWCFSQLKDAALLTLRIQKISLEHGMFLKDASAYNIQFYQGKPVLIDTLSFECYKEGSPWVAYRQFCYHFLSPLLLMSYKDMRFGSLLRVFIDGIPLDLTSTLLPKRTLVNPSLFSHVHLHSKSQSAFGNKKVNIGKYKISKQSLFGIIDNLEGAIGKLKPNLSKSVWGDYYEDTVYSRKALAYKKKLVANMIMRAKPSTVWDLGANTGLFSRLSSDMGIHTVSADMDYKAVEKNYCQMKSKSETNMLPLVIDVFNPSPAIGWGNKERESFLERGPVDCVIALALIHHLAISNNVPLENVAKLFHRTCKYLIIEFVSKSDRNVQRLLSNRVDVFGDYSQNSFEGAFNKYFNLISKRKIVNTKRTLYLFKKKRRIVHESV